MSLTKVKSSNVNFTAPTVTKYTSGSGTYTTPSGVKHIKVKMVGGGGGGAGSGNTTTGGAGGDGGNTTFGTSLLTANGGKGGSINSGGYSSGGDGGTASINIGATGFTIRGACGQSGGVS